MDNKYKLEECHIKNDWLSFLKSMYTYYNKTKLLSANSNHVDKTIKTILGCIFLYFVMCVIKFTHDAIILHRLLPSKTIQIYNGKYPSNYDTTYGDNCIRDSYGVLITCYIYEKSEYTAYLLSFLFVVFIIPITVFILILCLFALKNFLIITTQFIKKSFYAIPAFLQNFIILEKNQKKMYPTI